MLKDLYSLCGIYILMLTVLLASNSVRQEVYVNDMSPIDVDDYINSKEVSITLCLSSCLQQEIRNQASEYPYRVAKLPANRNLNRYRDVSPCESYEK